MFVFPLFLFAEIELKYKPIFFSVDTFIKMEPLSNIQCLYECLCTNPCIFDIDKLPLVTCNSFLYSASFCDLEEETHKRGEGERSY